MPRNLYPGVSVGKLPSNANGSGFTIKKNCSPLQQHTLGRLIESKKGRSNGVAIFAGRDSEKKLKVAGAMAQELNLQLYRIDLSAVVSKYIGETEKNLGRIFDAAEQGRSILFFDEADALFGARSEVKDSHDRYAITVTNYLLQRMEAYPGLAVMSTNAKSAIDDAFLRRIRYLVSFPLRKKPKRRRLRRSK